MAEIGQNKPNYLLLIPSDNICPSKAHLITKWGNLVEFQHSPWHVGSSQ